MRVLVTRPQPEGERTARALRERGHEVLLAPLMRVEAIADARIGAGPWSAVVFTSANAVQAFATHPAQAQLRAAPVFVVGARTAAVAQACGFATVRSADGDVAALTRVMAQSDIDRTRPVLYLAGEERARDLGEMMAPYGFRVQTVPIYRAVIVGELPSESKEALARGAVDAVLHFSARSARAFIAAVAAADVQTEGMALRHLCLSAEIAAPLIAAGAQHVTIAPRPDQQTLLDLLNHP